MNAPTNIQMINGPDGKPAFVVIPYADYVEQFARDSRGAAPAGHRGASLEAIPRAMGHGPERRPVSGSGRTVSQSGAYTAALHDHLDLKADARHKGGLNLFGHNFGNYPQDIVMRIHYDFPYNTPRVTIR